MKSIKHVWSVLCTNSSVDSSTNNISLFNVIEQIQLEGLDQAKLEELKNEVKSVGFNLELVTYWKSFKKGELEIDQYVEFIDPEGKVLNKLDVPFKTKKDEKGLRNILKIQGINFTLTGEYKYRIYAKERNETKYELVNEIPLDIKVK